MASNREGNNRLWRRLSPGVVAGGYAVVGLVWIVTSDLLLATFGIDGLDVNLSLLKGIGFVLVTGGLLYLLLSRREQWLDAARQELTRWVGADREEDFDHLRVLLVDDDAASRGALRATMEHAAGVSLAIDEVSDAATARSIILEARHDVFLVDQSLPETTGIELIRQLHHVAPGPMILLVDGAEPPIDDEALRSGVHDTLIKHEFQPSWIGRTLRYAVANWRTQREIARTRQWYSEIVSEAPIGLFRSTPEGGLAEANPALLDIFGADTVDDIRRLAPLYRDPAARAQLIARVAAGEVIEDEDIEMQRLDGTPIDVRMRMRGITSDGRLIALYGALVDVTDQLRTEQRVRTQASMLDQVENAVVRTDLAGSITYWNRAAERVFGWSAEEVLGRPVIEVTPAPEEIPRARGIIRHIARHGSWEGEFRCRRKDGSDFPAYVTNALLEADGRATGYVGITVDLTELRQAEERAATEAAMAASVLESVRFPAAVMDEQGTITAVNSAWVDTAVANGADLDAVGVGVNYLDVCDRATGEDAVIVGRGIRDVLSGQDASLAHEYACGDKWFRLEVARAVHPLPGAIAMHIDVTELHEAARQAEEFARGKDRLIASVSHELRTPLTAVLGFADLLEHPEGMTPEERTQFAQEIHRQATDMAAIVEDLLISARAEMGALTIQLAAVDVAAEAREVVRHADGVVDRIDDTPLVLADALRLRQVLRNLVTNALRYGGPRVTVESRVHPDRVEIRVADDGPGVPDHLTEAVFQPFVRAHERSGQPDSLGLGLSVVRMLTEAMGGTVELIRDDGWTVFTVALPRADR